MKLSYILGLLLLAAAALPASGQQDAQYTQFMNNKLALNPAFAGSKGAPVFHGLVRQQWFGLKGAPSTQVVGFNTPLARKNLGVGIVLSNDVIGFTRSTRAEASVGYHIRLGQKTYLSGALSASARQYRIDWSEARATDAGDVNIPDIGQSSRLLGNVGAGFLLYSDDFYAGISVPRVLQGRLTSDTDVMGLSFAGREETHAYLMGGARIELREDLALKPAALVKYAARSPLDVDLHVGLEVARLVTVGLTYRFGGDSETSGGESLDLLASLQASERLKIGVAYDFTLSKIRQASDGSAELFVEFTLGSSQRRLTNPRFF